MSDATSLSSDYSFTAEFAKEFSGAVLLLKRIYLAPSTVPAPALEEEAEARKKLGQHLRSVILQLAPDEGETSVQTDRVPDGVITRLAEKNRDKMGWFIEDVRQAEASLRGATLLGREEFTVLDEVCDAADATASASFRRLWRR